MLNVIVKFSEGEIFYELLFTSIFSLFFCSKLYEMKNNKLKDICILRTECFIYDNHLFTGQQPVQSYSVVTSFTSTPPWERRPVISSLAHVYSSPMVCCMVSLAPQTLGLQEWLASKSSSKWPFLEQIIFFFTTFMICCFEVTSSAKECTVHVNGWNDVLPIPEYSGSCHHTVQGWRVDNYFHVGDLCSPAGDTCDSCQPR